MPAEILRLGGHRHAFPRAASRPRLFPPAVTSGRQSRPVGRPPLSAGRTTRSWPRGWLLCAVATTLHLAAPDPGGSVDTLGCVRRARGNRRAHSAAPGDLDGYPLDYGGRPRVISRGAFDSSRADSRHCRPTPDPPSRVGRLRRARVSSRGYLRRTLRTLRRPTRVRYVPSVELQDPVRHVDVT
jgi:hypothetical protein